MYDKTALSAKNTIYVSVANYLDAEIIKTVEDIFNNASNPSRVSVGIAHNVDFDNKNHINDIQKKFYKYPQVTHLLIEKSKSIGVGYGRLAAASMYNNQDYFLQLDSHTMLTKNWDEILINEYSSAKQEYPKRKIVLTGYLPGYKYVDEQTREFVDGNILMYPSYIAGSELDVKDTDDPSERIWNEVCPNIPKWMTQSGEGFKKYFNSEYPLCRKINANFIFAGREFAKNYQKYFPWDYLFFEEEFIMSIEAYDDGYIFVFPTSPMPLGHLYGNDFNEFYPDRINVERNSERENVSRKRVHNYLSKISHQDKIKSYCEYAGLSYPELHNLNPVFVPSLKDDHEE